MRYIVSKKENSSPTIAIWPKSLHRIVQKNNQDRECSHRDYLRNNNIPFTDVSSLGLVYCDPQTKQMEVSVLPWDTPAPSEDAFLVQKKVLSFLKEHPELKKEIQEDWDQYQAWVKKSQEMSASLTGK